MPIYEYQCGRCGERFERIQKFSDPPVDACPSCGGVVERLLSSPAIQFKGSGFYITDYARSGKDGKSGKDAASGKDGTSGKPADAPAASGDKSEASAKAEATPKPATAASE